MREKNNVDQQMRRCCSSVEQISWKKGGQGMRDEAVYGWKISQVEALIGLPPRDIQRACYDGSGGFGLVKPRNTTWGWRVYETTDLAKLFMLAQARKRGKTLDGIRNDRSLCYSSEKGKGQASHLYSECYRARVRCSWAAWISIEAIRVR